MTQPDIKGSIIRNANPEGCHHFLEQQWQKLSNIPAGTAFKSVLVLGCSSGFGLASRLVTLRNGADTSIGVCYEKSPSDNHSGSAGWHLDNAYQKLASSQKQQHITLNTDAFSSETKAQVIQQMQAWGKKFDLVIYSVAAGVKLNAKGEKIRSSILPTTQSVNGLQVDLEKDSFFEMELPAATQQQIDDTVAIMGGQDWQDWLTTLSEAGLLTDDCQSYNYSYLGADLNAAIYRNGTLGAAKQDMHLAAQRLREQGFKATVVVCKALVTKASLFIPLMAPYVMALKAVLSAKNQDEDIFDQMVRLFQNDVIIEDDILRLDNYELASEVQAEVQERIESMSADNFKQYIDYDGVKKELLALHGFL